MPDPAYIIGIDLGTTNSIVAYSPASIEKGDPSDIRVFEIPQLVAPGTMENRRILPSFIYLPPGAEFKEGAFALPWDDNPRIVVGEYARTRSAEVPQRVISSAKSWLCNTSVDRTKPLLPWEAPPDVQKMSPVSASAAILSYIRSAWNHQMAADDPSLAMENQEILLTVPASFDAVARELTVKAAEAAGIPNITLLEEPQAAFYSWISESNDQWRSAVEEGDLVLICDVGGGTTDFSLIRVTSESGELVLERTAVGDHLLVGGDNMDLALAYAVAGKMAEKGTRLDTWQIRGLIHACRGAKEKMYTDPGIGTFPVTILGRGSSLVGGTLKIDLTADEISSIVQEGFYPHCEASSRPAEPQKSGLQEAGLIYAADPAITRHLAAFIERQGIASDEKISRRLPSAVLFNGGVMKAEAIRQQVMDVLRSWDIGNAASIREIQADDFDLAVACGAAYYGLARRGKGIRIRGGLGKSYYIGIAAAMPAIPGMPAPVKALCVAPFGMEEGTSADILDREFVLVIGEPVRFDFLGSSIRKDDLVGAVIEDWQNEIEEITTLETTLDGESGAAVRVTLEISVTEVGTLEIRCVSKDDGRKWKLEFMVRERG